MISRVAESCFWLLRYIDRAESCARLVSVNRLIVLDANVEASERWRPVIVVVGERERFEELFGPGKYEDDDHTEDYLTWSEKNPVSIRSNLYWARENARMIREVISREMWETINTSWQWFNSRAAQREYKKDRSQFYQRIRSMCAEFQGVSHDTMLHEEPWDFMQLGTTLERANQTARLMDVTHHRVASSDKSTLETPWQSAQWVSQLRLCAADESFFKRKRAAPTGRDVAGFLLQDPSFPRSVRHCYERAEQSLAKIEAAAERRRPTASLLAVRAMVERLSSQDIGSVIQSGLHAELTHVVNTTAAVCEQLHHDFFDPSTEFDVELASRPPGPRSQSQTQQSA
ncbi:MAG TPA: alpha-E domain-containing protein [Polyangiaceae bacterium]|nr:alpha-E domain-containing protein [Polyangiaceae bacterium]